MAVFRATWTIAHPSLGGIGTNTWHARTTAATSPLRREQLDALNGFLGEFYVAIQGNLAGGTVLDFDGEWVQVDQTPGELISGDGNNLVAAGSGAPLPPANCQVVSWRTSQASKRGRGRTFLGPLNTATLQDNGTPTEASREVVQDAADAFIASFDGIDNGAFGVYSTLDNVLRDFVTARVPNEFASLRSRRD